METNNKITISFLGASETVTGSKYLIQANEKTILVDCGLFQGLKKLRLLNWDTLPFAPDKIDVVLITHGHLDHVGYLPKLVKEGFNKKILASSPTLDVAEIILKDSAHIQEEDAERANREHFSKHKPALPLYNSKDVEKTISHFSAVPLNEWITLFNDIEVRYKYNGHIIGATFIELKINGKIIVFSGDVGREKDLLMEPPQKPQQADVLFIESTYGDTVHPENAEEKLAAAITKAFERSGTIVIPGFALERIQLLMYMIWKLKKQNIIPPIPVYMDSPMARAILDVFHKYKEWHKIPLEEFSDMCKDIHLIEKIEETNALAAKTQPKIIIAGSGMATGGRVLTYLLHYISNPSATVMLVGYQAEGTRGRSLLEGEKQLKIYGKYYEVKATVENIEGLSAHADQKELISWMSELKNKPEKIFVVHGETEASQALREKIKEVYGWDSQTPKLYDGIEINL